MTEPLALSACYQCGGALRLVTGPGRTVMDRGVAYDLPDDLAILTCLACGAEWTDGATEEALDAVVRAQRDAKNDEGPTDS